MTKYNNKFTYDHWDSRDKSSTRHHIEILVDGEKIDCGFWSSIESYRVFEHIENSVGSHISGKVRTETQAIAERKNKAMLGQNSPQTNNTRTNQSPEGEIDE